jgi:Arc/MetJ family transcription regulator
MMRIKKHAEVRTTVSIDDEVLEKARREARGQGVTLSQIVNQALIQTLSKSAHRGAGQAFRMLTFQGDEGRPDVDLTPAMVAQLRDQDTT